MIVLNKVVKRYQERLVIDALSLTLKKGEITVVIGPSGSGKSTLLKLINRLEEPDSGQIFFAGQEIRAYQPDDLRRRMGYVIQSIGLFPHWSVARNVSTVPRLLGWEKKRIAARVDELLQVLGLDPEDFAHRYPHELSGGQQQRVGVARALVADPEVLLMDEPFGALDPITRANMQVELKRVQQLLGTTVLFITHDMQEALYLGEHIVLLDGGRIRQSGAAEDFRQRPVDDFVRGFVGAIDGNQPQA